MGMGMGLGMGMGVPPVVGGYQFPMWNGFQMPVQAHQAIPRVPADPVSPRQRAYLQDLLNRGVMIAQVTHSLSGDVDRQLNVGKGEYLEVIEEFF